MLGRKIKVVDGVRYIVKECPYCKAELLFKERKERIRLHCVCKTCGKQLEFQL